MRRLGEWSNDIEIMKESHWEKENACEVSREVEGVI